MSYTVRHQVFVSSTFTDLVAERAEVIQAIWELDCIPTGMEAFVASNESQWVVIQRVIDECDYYVLILGGRYGSVTDEGVSYTEKEYQYARSIGLPVLAFTHKDPGQIAASKTDLLPEARLKLDAFRKHVRDHYPVKEWTTPSELGGFVSRSLVREIKLNPRPGWIRNDEASPIDLMEKISLLTEENARLRESAVATSNEATDETLQQGSDEIELNGTRLTANRSGTRFKGHWSAEASWDDIFKDIGPLLITETSEARLRDALAEWHVLQALTDGHYLENSTISDETWADVIVQFRALGFIEPGTKKRAISDRHSYWKTTSKGDKHLVGLLAKRRASKPD